MLKNRTEQHCWTTLIKTKARFLILSFGMWVTEFSSSAWNKALNNSKQIFFFFFLVQYLILQTSLLLQNTEHHYIDMTTRHWQVVMKFGCCIVKHPYRHFAQWAVFHCWTIHVANQCKLQVSMFPRKKDRSSLRNLPDLELRNPVLWQFR